MSPSVAADIKTHLNVSVWGGGYLVNLAAVHWHEHLIGCLSFIYVFGCVFKKNLIRERGREQKHKAVSQIILPHLRCVNFVPVT